MVTITLKGIKREKVDAVGQEPGGKGKEVCVENEEMQRVKYQGSTATYYKKRGALCIQWEEMNVRKIKDQITEEEEEADPEGIMEQKVMCWKDEGKTEHKERNKKLTNAEVEE